MSHGHQFMHSARQLAQTVIGSRPVCATVFTSAGRIRFPRVTDVLWDGPAMDPDSQTVYLYYISTGRGATEARFHIDDFTLLDVDMQDGETLSLIGRAE